MAGKRPKTVQRHSREAIALRLKIFREHFAKLSPAEFADRMGIGRPRYSNYETGERPLTLDAALIISKHWGVTLDWLFTGDTRGLPGEIIRDLPTQEYSSLTSGGGEAPNAKAKKAG